MTQTKGAGYCGRFAPSPSGPLHRGSLVAAIASYLDARAHRGQWFVRIDDIDPPRCANGASEAITHELDRLGLHADGPVQYQSDRDAAYRCVLDELATSGATFDCGCTRKEVAGNAYRGTCEDGLPPGREARSVRLRVPDEHVTYEEYGQGTQSVSLGTDPGAFIVRRADGLVAYHLACVLDDAQLGVTHVVRGCDLSASTGPQVWLYRVLGLTNPLYRHVPVLCDDAGAKLSKHTFAPTTSHEPAVTLWRDTLAFLGLEPPIWDRATTLEHIREWAITAWAEHSREPPR
ncbi:MAG: tRNA glutamyl-Q(34) synthetase GluQRS [Chromatiales bacterium]|jgi:glutamyl-Q tRNA(Asp) synthetase|nr:tRNA glutamyl-Q(34) synthetase GluQRS [Chromatiales bacterium]